MKCEVAQVVGVQTILHLHKPTTLYNFTNTPILANTARLRTCTNGRWAHLSTETKFQASRWAWSDLPQIFPATFHVNEAAIGMTYMGGGRLSNWLTDWN